jgi:hypothetical protein
MKKAIFLFTIFLLLSSQAKAVVSSAVGNIAVNVADISPELKPAVDAYNMAMGVIGVRNLGKGVINFARELPDNVKTLVRENKSIKALLTEKYLDCQVAITRWNNLTDAEKRLITRQEQVWKALLQTLPENTYLYNPNMADNVRQIVLKSGESMDKFVNINYRAANGIASIDEIKWLQNFVTKNFPNPKVGDELRKIIPLNDFEIYQKSVTNPRLPRAGFVTKVEDYNIPNNSAELIENLRLDYSGTKFSQNDGFAVIEYSNQSSNVTHPFNTSQANNNALPYTNTGMSGSKTNIIPEYYSPDEVIFSNGDIMKIFDKNGNIIESYTYKEELRKWIKE